MAQFASQDEFSDLAQSDLCKRINKSELWPKNATDSSEERGLSSCGRDRRLRVQLEMVPTQDPERILRIPGCRFTCLCLPTVGSGVGGFLHILPVLTLTSLQGLGLSFADTLGESADVDTTFI